MQILLFSQLKGKILQQLQNNPTFIEAFLCLFSLFYPFWRCSVSGSCEGFLPPLLKFGDLELEQKS